MNQKTPWTLSFFLTIVGATCFGGSPVARGQSVERVEFKQGDKQRRVVGEVLVEAQDGGLLLRARNQVMWAIQPDEILSRLESNEPLPPLTGAELASSVLQELPPGFRVHTTAHYVICYNTTRAYAEWCGALYERLHRAFMNYWTRKGLKLQDTPPLIACVFQSRKSYEDYGREELGKASGSIIGYYSYKTNRIATYDLTSADSLRPSGRVRSAAHVNQLLRRAERTVATIIHEATHQLAFNCGLHQRFADIPLWLSEGMAIYFETPDLRSNKGWRTIGKVNRVRLGQFRHYQKQRPPASLLSLLGSDERFRDTSLATGAYAESWAFCYFLIRNYPRQFVRYLEVLQAKAPLDDDTPQQRLDDFRNAFGVDPRELDADFLRQIQRVN